MLKESTKKTIRDRLAMVGNAMPGFRSRYGQRLMIAEVAKTLAHAKDVGNGGVESPGKQILVVNGGTGVGKSLGYMLPAITLTQESGLKLVIATATVTLQEQLVSRDVPDFLKAMGLEHLKVMLAKGRTRYACHFRLEEVAAGMRQQTIIQDNEAALDKIQRDEVVSMLGDFNRGDWDGDRDQRPPVADEVWRRITTDRSGCLGKKCSSYKRCAQMAARQRLKDSDIIVANHDLVLSDLAMGGGKVFPIEPGGTVFVMDEGHHLPAKAVSAFATSHNVGGARGICGRLEDISGMLKHAGAGVTDLAGQLQKAALELRRSLGEAYSFFESIEQLRPSNGHVRPMLEFKMSAIPPEFQDLGRNIISRADEILGICTKLKEALEEDEDLASLGAEIGMHAGNVAGILECWELLLEEPPLDQPPIAKWVETVKVKRGYDYCLNASPVIAADKLQELFWKRAAGVIITSASLKSCGDFKEFLKNSGLTKYPDVVCVDAPSPFDYGTQGVIEIPKMKSSAKDHEKHTAEAAEFVTGYLKEADGGVLVLFASRRQLTEVAAQLPPELREHVLLQGEISKAEILRTHEARIRDGQKSAIFGMESFSEGVDLKGDSCTHVVVAKLPFSVPEDPILSALSAWVESRGKNSFEEIFVPAAARKLEQSVGRLIRTETDHGRITVLDQRLWTTGYGRTMLRGLPPFKVIALGREVTP